VLINSDAKLMPITDCKHVRVHVVYVQVNPVVTTVYATYRLCRRTFCGSNSVLLIVTLHNSVITTLVYKDTKYSVR
jgi:hypothetical protein